MIMAAICDDENNVCSAIEKMLFKAAMQLNLQIQTDVYYSGERLCERLEAGEYYDDRLSNQVQQNQRKNL